MKIIEPYLHNLIIKQSNTRLSCLYSILTTMFVLITTAFITWLFIYNTSFSAERLGILFIIPVLFSTIFYGLGFGLITTGISVFAYNFVLSPITWYFDLFSIENATKVAVFSLVVIITNALVSRLKKLAKEAIQRERILSGVYALSHEILGITHMSDLCFAAQAKLSSLLETKVEIILKEQIDLKNSPLKFCLEKNIPTGYNTPYFSENENLYFPLRTNQDVIGVMCVTRHHNHSLFSEHLTSENIATLAAQTASAIEKSKLAQIHEKKLLEMQREKFLFALLSSVSHDFKTPLVTVIGVLSSLKDNPNLINDFAYREMISASLEEAKRLDRFVSNLMHISRLESGIDSIPKEPVSLRDILANVMKSLNSTIIRQHFSISTSSDFPLLRVNSVLMELVIMNLIENAIKYGPSDGNIKIIATCHPNAIIIDIDDDGEGIPETEREAVFLKFYRSKYGDSKIAGTGLGLYICKAIVEAHKGTINAINSYDGKGACMRITLPIEAAIPINMDHEIE